MTGPNITSQGLLFEQLSIRLREEDNGPVVVLRSGDATNLKAILKQLIRDATNQVTSETDDIEYLLLQKDVSPQARPVCKSLPARDVNR